MLESDVGTKGFGIAGSDAEGIVGDIPGGHLGVWQFQSQRDGNAAATGSDVEDIGIGLTLTDSDFIVRLMWNLSDSPCLSVFVRCKNPAAEFFCFRPWDEHARLHMELPTAEVGYTYYILYRLAFLQSKHDFFQFRLVMCG